MRRSHALLTGSAVAAAAVSVAGCGLGAGPAPTAVQLLVTRDFGAQPVPAHGALNVSGQETVMSLLVRNYAVATRYQGGFVHSIDGYSGGSEGGEPVDWFYYVNGVQAPRGAAETNVHPGDHIWWDRHDWSQAQDVPAVVGSFPEPFLDGVDGKRLPVRIECEDVTGPACRAVGARLGALGVPAATAAAGTPAGAQTLRVLVGTWAHLQGDPAARPIAEGPHAGGVYARFTDGGRALLLLNQNGGTATTLAGTAGLVAATRHDEDAPAWIITGTDPAGVGLAAQSLRARALRDHFALAVSPGRATAVPVTEGG